MLIVHFELYRFSQGPTATSFPRIFDLVDTYNILTREQRQIKTESIPTNPTPQYSGNQSYNNANSMNLPLYSQNIDHQVQFVQENYSLNESIGREIQGSNDNFSFLERDDSDNSNYQKRYKRHRVKNNKNSYKKHSFM